MTLKTIPVPTVCHEPKHTGGRETPVVLVDRDTEDDDLDAHVSPSREALCRY